MHSIFIFHVLRKINSKQINLTNSLGEYLLIFQALMKPQQRKLCEISPVLSSNEKETALCISQERLNPRLQINTVYSTKKDNLDMPPQMAAQTSMLFFTHNTNKGREGLKLKEVLVETNSKTEDYCLVFFISALKAWLSQKD